MSIFIHFHNMFEETEIDWTVIIVVIVVVVLAGLVIMATRKKPVHGGQMLAAAVDNGNDIVDIPDDYEPEVYEEQFVPNASTPQNESAGQPPKPPPPPPANNNPPADKN